MSPKRPASSHRSIDQWRVEAVANQLSTALEERDPDEPSQPPEVSFQDGEMMRFAQYVLTCDKWRYDTVKVTDLISLALVPTAWPSEDFQPLRKATGPAATSGVCGKVWKQDELAYKCKTCERDPTCVICVQCFKNGDHTGHEYAMVRTSGGCCDCGDVQAWHPDGFCRHHRGAFPEDADPAVGLPPALERNLREAIEAIAMHILTLSYRSRSITEPPPTHSVVTHASGLVDWLTGIVQIGDGIRRLVGLILIDRKHSWEDEQDDSHRYPDLPGEGESDKSKFSWLSAMLELDGVDKLPADLQSSLHALYFQLISDLVFKRTFLTLFVANYERYVHAQLARKWRVEETPSEDRQQHKTDIVENFTVQLFTVPALVPVMIQRGGLLDVLMDLLLNLFETWSKRVGLYSKAVPLSQSEYMRKSARDKECPTVSEAVASSSTSPPPRRRRFQLPLPFSAKDDDQKEIKDSSKNEVFPAPNQAANIAVLRRQLRVLQRELRVPRRIEVENNAAPTGTDTAERNRADEPREVPPPNPGGVGTIDDESHPGRNEETQDAGQDADAPAPDEGNEAVNLEEELTFADVAEELAFEPETHEGDAEHAIQIELDDDGDGAQVIVVLDNSSHEGNAENGDEEPDHNIDDEPSVLQQFSVLESGLHYAPQKHARVATHLTDTTPFLSAVQEARAMASDAYNGKGPLCHTMRLSWSHGSHSHQKISDWVFLRVVNDLKYILTHRSVAFHLVHVRRDLFRKLVRIISIAQGMYPIARRFKDHIAMERDSWADSFTVEIEFYHYVELLALAFCDQQPPGLTTTMDEVTSGSETLDLSASRLECIRIVRSCLDEWLEREEAIESRSVFAGEAFTLAHAVSVHLPLHRFLAYMVHHVIRLDHIDVRTALGGGDSSNCSSEDAKRLLKHPLRVQSFLSQVRAGMWRRNGHPVVGQSMFYRSVFCSEWFVDLDIFLQQCCAVVLGPDVFVKEAQDAFRIHDIATVIGLRHASPKQDNNAAGNDERGAPSRPADEPPQDHGSGKTPPISPDSKAKEQENCTSAKDIGFLPLAPRRYSVIRSFSAPVIVDAGNTKVELANFAPTLVEDLLTYIIRIAFERSRCGSRELVFLRRKLLHQLFCRDRTHSQLYRACSYRICHELSAVDKGDDRKSGGSKSETMVEAILAYIAHYVEPKGMDQGKYRIKDEMWKEFDPFSPHLSLRDRCSAEVRHAAACKRQNRKMQVIPEENVNQRPVFPQLRDLLNLSVACSGKDGLATSVLRKLFEKEGGPHSLEGATSAAMHLVCAAVELPRADLSNSNSNCVTSVGNQSEFNMSAIGVVTEIYGLAMKSESNPFTEFIPVLERIIVQAYERGDTSLRKILMQVAPNLTISRASSSSGHAGSDDSLSPQEARRKALLRKRKEQQQAAAMARIRKAQELFAKQLDDGHDSVTDKKSSTPNHDAGDQVSPSLTKEAHEAPIVEDTTNTVETQHSAVQPEDQCEEECALCHERGSSKDNKIIGYIGFHQRTNLPRIAQEDCEKLSPKRANALSPNPQDVQGTDTRRHGSSSNGSGDRNEAPIQEQNEDVTPEELGKSARRHMSGHHNSYFIDSDALKRGIEGTSNVHVSFCGHAIHLHCFERYFKSLVDSKTNQSMFEGYNVVNLDKMEFLCLVCRRLSNMVLPVTKRPIPGTVQSAMWRPDDSHSKGGLSHSEWAQSHTLELMKVSNRFNAPSAERSKKAQRSASPASREPHRRVADAMSVANLLNRGRAVLQEFGFRSFLGRQAEAEGRGNEGEGSARNSFPAVALSTAACAEIAARSESWDGQVLQGTRKSLSLALQEARAEILTENENQMQDFCELWKDVHDKHRVDTLDPFATTAFLMLLWPKPLGYNDARNILIMGFNLVQEQSNAQGNGDVTSQAQAFFSTLLFLRRCAVLVSSLVDSHNSPPIACYSSKLQDATLDEVHAELNSLIHYFGIPSPTGIDDHFLKADLDKLTLGAALAGFRPRRIGLLELPYLFQTLLEDLDGKLCVACEKIPKSPALCLVCGNLVCSSSSKSCRSGKLGAHSQECGAGIGVFLILKNTNVHIIRGDRNSSWGSPYLDAHGEEDKKFTRGKPLYLNRGRYASLEQLWLLHGFDQDSRVLNTTIAGRFNHLNQPL